MNADTAGNQEQEQRRPNPVRTVEPLDRFLHRVDASLRDGTFVRLVLSSPTAAAGAVQRVVGRLVAVRGETLLSLTRSEAKRDMIQNLPVAGAGEALRGILQESFQAAFLEAKTRDWQLQQPAGKPARLVGHPSRHRESPAKTHDQERRRALDNAVDWQHALGLVDEGGRPLPSRADKHRQVERYAEILGHLARDCGWGAGKEVRIADMGCGRGYLTFAVWHLLRRELECAATVTGVEARAELVEECEAMGRRLGLDGLAFVQGSIAETKFEALDGLLALHACNTATDDALLRGIELGCQLIVLAPCCHQELRPQLVHPETLDPILKHGLMAERLAEWLTDGLRALYLEWAGYRVKTIEFVAGEHTPKNLLLTATRGPQPFTNPAAKARILAIQDQFGVRLQKLARLLDHE